MSLIKLKIVIIIFLFGLFSTLVYATNNNDIILPLKFSQQGFPITSIHIQGHNIPLIFDTGATHSAVTLSNDLLRRLHLRIVSTNKITCAHDDSGKQICNKVYTIPKIKIGSITMHDVPCQLIDKLWGGHYEEGFIWFEAAKNGVLGLDLLRQFNILIDYKNAKVVFTKLGQYPHRYDLKDWTQIPIFNKHGITTNANINGTNVTLVWDTGANNSIMKSTTKITAKKISCAYKANPNCEYFYSTTFTVNSKQLPKTRFAVQDDELPFDGLVGSSFFKKHLVFIDFKNNQIYSSK